MSRFENRSTLEISYSFQSCLLAAERSISACGAADVITQANAGHASAQVIGTVGSGVKVRLLGALMAPKHWLPLKITLEVTERGEMRTVTCIVEENFGFGSLIGVERKFKDRCKEVHELLVQTFQSNLPQ